MDKYELQARTRQFALRIINLVSHLPKSPQARVMGDQVLRSGTSIGANYVEACHARSRADFIAKVKICEAEAAETHYWLDLLIRSGVVSEAKLGALRNEAAELLAIMAATTKTSREAR